jgi:hypothetical protein
LAGGEVRILEIVERQCVKEMEMEKGNGMAKEVLREVEEE